jgi:hypothetical protein
MSSGAMHVSGLKGDWASTETLAISDNCGKDVTEPSLAPASGLEQDQDLPRVRVAVSGEYFGGDIMKDHPSRRRLLAISAGLFGTALPPMRAIAQGTKPKLPECKASATFGDWIALAYDLDGLVTPASSYRSVRKLSDSVADADFKYRYYKTSFSYEINFRLRRDPAAVTFDVALTASDGSGNKASMSPKETTKAKTGQVSIKLDVSAWFREPDNLLKRAKSSTITVANAGAQLFSIELASNGFAEAVEFVRREQARLELMEKNKQCEGDCFLTTACCELIGLDDDCFELRALRAFRDGPLSVMPGGKEDILRYYRGAPLILAEISRRGDSHHLLWLYATHVLPSAVAARLGLNRLARALYSDMMRRLELRYFWVCRHP